jgi:hypothetical protein
MMELLSVATDILDKIRKLDYSGMDTSPASSRIEYETIEPLKSKSLEKYRSTTLESEKIVK